MSKKIKPKPGEDVIVLPKNGKVYKANWKDDIDPTIELDEFDIKLAEIKHGKRVSWKNFQVFGTTNKKEGEYVPNGSRTEEEMQEALERAKASKIGLKISQIVNFESRLMKEAA